MCVVVWYCLQVSLTRVSLKLYKPKEKAKILSIEVEPQSDNPFGRRSAGSMNIRGRFKELTRCPSLFTIAPDPLLYPGQPENYSESGYDPIERQLNARFSSHLRLPASSCKSIVKFKIKSLPFWRLSGGRSPRPYQISLRSRESR